MAILDGGSVTLTGDSSTSFLAKKIINALVNMSGGSSSFSQLRVAKHESVLLLGASEFSSSASKLKHADFTATGSSSISINVTKAKHATLTMTGESSFASHAITISPDQDNTVISGSSMLLIDLFKVITVKKKSIPNILVRTVAKPPQVRSTPSVPSPSYSLGTTRTSKRPKGL